MFRKPNSISPSPVQKLPADYILSGAKLPPDYIGKTLRFCGVFE
jgi:hypothetical protein